MKKLIAGLLFAGLACSAAQAQVKISAIYGGGSSTSTTFFSEFQYDFIELKNNGTSAVTLTGHSLQYRSGTGTAFTGKINLPSITIPAQGFFLIRTEPGQSGTCGAGAPCRPIGTPDFTASTGGGGSGQIQLSATNGVVALLSTQTLVTTPACITGNPAVLDLVGFGAPDTSTTCFEGSGPTGSMGNQFVSVRVLAGCQDTNNNAADFQIQSSEFTPRNSASPAAPCTGGCPADCDQDTLCDRDEINANGGVNGVGGTLDCNSNGQLDACEITTNPQIDCDGNGQIDTCEIAANPALDCDNNNAIDICQILTTPALDCNNNFTLDSCEIAATPSLDCDGTGALDTCERAANPSFYDSNNNGINDGCETPGPGQDCNGNNKLDSWDLRTYVLTDVDNNGTPDTCEGAVYVEVPVNATVQTGGNRANPNGSGFFNIEGATFVGNESYGGLRWPVSSVMGSFPNGTTASRVYLRLVQSNAGFTSGGSNGAPDMEVFWSNNDTISFAPGNTNTLYGGFATDYADRQSVTTYDFVRGTNPPVFGSAAGSGTIENYKLFDVSGTNTAGGTSVANELNSGGGDLTIVMNVISPIGDGVAATYSGWNSPVNSLFQLTGPALVVFPGTGGPVCDSIDFNNDTSVFDPQDIDAFLSVYSEGPCIPEEATCNDIDFNNDTSLFDPCDISSFLLVFSEGPCELCPL